MFLVKGTLETVIRFLRGGGTATNHFFFFSQITLLLLCADRGGGEDDRNWVRMLVSYLLGVKISDLVLFTMSQTLVDHQRPSWHV